MSNLDNIINKILQDAQDEAKKIIEEVESEIAVLVGDSENKAQLEADKIVEKSRLESMQLKDRIISNSNLTARDMVLVAKQEVISMVFDRAKEKLKNLEHSRYLNFVENTLKKLEIKEDSEIILTEKEKALTDGKLFNIKVADETVESGFSLKNGKIILNNDFSSILDVLKEDIEQEIAEKLFS